MKGILRSDLLTWLRTWQIESDLMLALGTSLSGMNADSVVQESRNAVIISLQATPYDKTACLRIWAKLDDVFQSLASLLDVETTEPIN